MWLLAESGWDETLQEQAIPILAIGGGFLVAIVAIVFGCIKSMVVGRARELTKRELAAYVAEGSMSADHAVALANAGKRADDEG
jgi:uncharacterized membrane protein